MRIAILGAFQFPVPQGSQVFAAEQARALASAGADVTLVCYGRGVGAAPAGLELLRIPAALSPRSHRAGPRLAKPVADAALVAALFAAQRRRRFAVVIAHNAEAAWVARSARALTGVRVVYAAHTLLEEELPCFGPAPARAPLAALGRAADRVAARADAVVALSAHTARRLRAHARGPVECIPPGLEPAPPPAAQRVAAACARHGLAPGAYAIYSGNLDAYQDLPDLAGAAARLPELPLVAATHAPPRRLGALRGVRVCDADEARALLYGAALALLPRRSRTGFPVKVLNYMEAARPIVARAGVVDGLEHGRNAWLLTRESGPEALARAIAHLHARRDLAARLGAAARATLEARHAWPELARRTLALCQPAYGVADTSRASRPLVETRIS